MDLTVTVLQLRRPLLKPSALFVFNSRSNVLYDRSFISELLAVCFLVQLTSDHDKGHLLFPVFGVESDALVDSTVLAVVASEG